jgi:hypothetical protein
MPYKMIGIVPAGTDAFSAYHAYLSASERAKSVGAKKFYLGNPNREVGEIVQTKEEIRYKFLRFIPKPLQRLWYRIRPPRSWFWGVYVEVSREENGGSSGWYPEMLKKWRKNT